MIWYNQTLLDQIDLTCAKRNLGCCMHLEMTGPVQWPWKEREVRSEKREERREKREERREKTKKKANFFNRKRKEMRMRMQTKKTNTQNENTTYLV